MTHCDLLQFFRDRLLATLTLGRSTARFPSRGSVRTGRRDARVRKPGGPAPRGPAPPAGSRPAFSEPQGPCRPRRGAAPPPLRPAGCGRGGRQRCQRGNRCGPREAEVVSGTAGTSPDASAMDASLEKVGTERSGGAAAPGLRLPGGRLFPGGKGGRGLRSLAGGGRPAPARPRHGRSG